MEPVARTAGDGAVDGELVRARVDAELVVAQAAGDRGMYFNVGLEFGPIAQIVDALLQLADEAWGEAHPADSEPAQLRRKVDVVDGRGPVFDLVDGYLELERARVQGRGQMAMHRRHLDDRGPESRGRSAEGSRRQLEWAGVEIEPLGIAVPEHGRVIFEIGPGDRLKGGGDGVGRRVGRQIGHQ